MKTKQETNIDLISAMQNLSGFIFCFLLFFDSRILVPAISQSESIKLEKHVALFGFGDSLYDPGNNNFLNISIGCNYPPYGETYFKFPTGRCSDGHLIPYFIAKFASAGAGVLPATNPGTLNLEIQLIFFKEVASLLRQQLADAEVEKLLRNAVYLSSIGGEIYNIGGRKFAFQNVAPMGCLPFTKQEYNLKENECLPAVTGLSILRNNGLFKAAKELEMQLSDFKFLIFGFYTTLLERIINPLKYGFQEADIACCGSGIYRGPNCGIGEFELCSNPNEYLFFDGHHPTEHG
ncbi:hypothetical protein CUMW_201280 [Citrus unshiu]|uniref:SGNH hydrolase-type esterase domain-containing protein n=1 Tax=Citrus unshiu TaxID=55188 RepID=A0A2H5Q7U0_CITUN|nr:hypothetical protein CUMW_201280 [Citrus unshiu]